MRKEIDFSADRLCLKSKGQAAAEICQTEGIKVTNDSTDSAPYMLLVLSCCVWVCSLKNQTQKSKWIFYEHTLNGHRSKYINSVIKVQEDDSTKITAKYCDCLWWIKMIFDQTTTKCCQNQLVIKKMHKGSLWQHIRVTILPSIYPKFCVIKNQEAPELEFVKPAESKGQITETVHYSD